MLWYLHRRRNQPHGDASPRRCARCPRCGQKSRARVPIVRRQTDYYRADQLAERETETDQNTGLGASTLICRFSGSTKCPLWAGVGDEFIKDLLRLKNWSSAFGESV